MKKVLFVIVLLSVAGVGQAVETAYGEMCIDVDTTWVSKYIFRGIDVLDDKAAFQPSITMDLFGTGFSTGVWASLPGSSKGAGSVSTVDREEWDYFITYSNTVCEGTQNQLDYAVSWIYYDFPDMASKDRDMQEFNLAMAWPQVCSSGIVPSYTVVYTWPAKGGGAVAGGSGWIHVFGLGYPICITELPNPINFACDATFNDGAYGVDHDWSHLTWSLSTSLDCGPGTFTPAIYYQTSMENDVNRSDELWAGVSYGLTF